MNVSSSNNKAEYATLLMGGLRTMDTCLCRSFAVLLLLGQILPGQQAGANEKKAPLDRAIDFYYSVQYKKALHLFQHLTRSAKLDRADRIRMYKFKAFTLYAANYPDRAAATWKQLLRIDPAFELDPKEVPPEILSFFSSIQPPADDTAQGPAEEFSSSAGKEQMAEPDAPSVDDFSADDYKDSWLVYGIPDASTDSSPSGINGRQRPWPLDPPGVVLRLIPFGVGQYINHKPIRGMIFSISQAAFLAANFGIHLHLQTSSLRTEDVDKYNRRIAMQNVFLGLFITSAVYGVIDAFVFRD